MIIFKHVDNSIAIMELAPGADKDEAIRKFHIAHPGEYIEQYEGKFKLPESRANRDAWTFNGKTVVEKLT